jgi:hypothetical protein
MKRSVNAFTRRQRRAAPSRPGRVITTTYRFVEMTEVSAVRPERAPTPLVPLDSFSVLAARAYRQSKSAAGDARTGLNETV